MADTTMRGRLWSALRLAEVRLRLPIVLVMAAVVVGRWDVLRNYAERWTRWTPDESIAGHSVSADTEYFCPMDPGVLSDWPGRCGVCNMALVRRKKGEAAMLPDGVVARMQFSPYRVQLAGIKTAGAEFRPLARDWSTSGLLTRQGDSARVEVELPPRQAPWIGEGSELRVSCAEIPGLTMSGRVRSLADGAHDWQGGRIASVVIDRPPREARAGMVATIRSTQPVAEIEPFRSMPRNPPPPRPGEPRRLYACPNHDDSTALQPGRCPIDHKERIPRPLDDVERIRWWCPMHPAVTAEKAGDSCRDCGGMTLRPRVVVYAPAGQVLAVPQSAVVDTGDRNVVFVEGMPGMFDGIEVELGPRCGAFYPVVRGLSPGQRVAIAGAFLLDAETRLNPSLASAYFGAGGTRPKSAATDPTPTAAVEGRPSSSGLDALSPEDRSIADRQKTCPVTGMALGSMGTPERHVVSGRVVFLCCGGCRPKLLADPSKYAARVPGP
jgi:hypothetical protein